MTQIWNVSQNTKLVKEHDQKLQMRTLTKGLQDRQVITPGDISGLGSRILLERASSENSKTMLKKALGSKTTIRLFIKKFYYKTRINPRTPRKDKGQFLH